MKYVCEIQVYEDTSMVLFGEKGEISVIFLLLCLEGMVRFEIFCLKVYFYSHVFSIVTKDVLYFVL